MQFSQWFCLSSVRSSSGSEVILFPLSSHTVHILHSEILTLSFYSNHIWAEIDKFDLDAWTLQAGYFFIPVAWTHSMSSLSLSMEKLQVSEPFCTRLCITFHTFSQTWEGHLASSWTEVKRCLCVWGGEGLEAECIWFRRQQNQLLSCLHQRWKSGKVISKWRGMEKAWGVG